MKKVVFIIALLFINCTKEIDAYSLSTYNSEGNLNFYVEIPAGTNKKYEFDTEAKKLIINKIDNKDRIIKFLPYPVNYGFIPSTKSKKENGGDGDALDALLLSESIVKGTVVEVAPIGVLRLIDNEEEDYKILCVPVDESRKLLNISSMEELAKKHPAALKILELWFLNYDDDKLFFKDNRAWGNRKEALKIINESKN